MPIILHKEWIDQDRNLLTRKDLNSAIAKISVQSRVQIKGEEVSIGTNESDNVSWVWQNV